MPHRLATLEIDFTRPMRMVVSCAGAGFATTTLANTSEANRERGKAAIALLRHELTVALIPLIPADAGIQTLPQRTPIHLDKPGSPPPRDERLLRVPLISP